MITALMSRISGRRIRENGRIEESQRRRRLRTKDPTIKYLQKCLIEPAEQKKNIADVQTARGRSKASNCLTPQGSASSEKILFA